MTYCLTEPSHYLNHSWVITGDIKHSPECIPYPLRGNELIVIRSSSKWMLLCWGELRLNLYNAYMYLMIVLVNPTSTKGFCLSNTKLFISTFEWVKEPTYKNGELGWKYYKARGTPSYTTSWFILAMKWCAFFAMHEWWKPLVLEWSYICWSNEISKSFIAYVQMAPQHNLGEQIIPRVSLWFQWLCAIYRSYWLNYS